MEGLRETRDGQETREDVKDRADIPRDWLIPFLLLCLRDGGCYTYRLEEKLGELGVDERRSGEVCQVLWQMEREGMITCNRAGGGFKLPQWWYEVTKAGETCLEFCADSLARYREEVDVFLGTYADGSGPGTGQKLN